MVGLVCLQAEANFIVLLASSVSDVIDAATMEYSADAALQNVTQLGARQMYDEHSPRLLFRGMLCLCDCCEFP